MTREEAAEILEEVKLNDNSMYAYSEPYMTALDMAIGALKARETSLEKVAADYGLMPDGVAFALEQYQKVLCDITHNRLSKPTYYADDIIRLVHDVQCDGCELSEPRVMTLEELESHKVGEPLFYESRIIYPCWVIHLNSKTTDRIHFIGAVGNIYKAKEEYCVHWRCWTSRPTDEQREATPWESVK